VIDLRALAHNFALATRLAGGRPLYSVIKADAYGHGVVPVARALSEAGADRFSVLSVKEGVELRAAGVEVPILVLAGAASAAEADAAAGLDLVPTVHGPADVDLLATAAEAFGRTIRVHVEVDTGMRRMGTSPGDAVALMRHVKATDGVELEGAFTHFACADAADAKPSLEQIERFRAVLADAASEGIRPRELHTHNSAALLAGDPLADAFPEATAARPGLMLYGVAQDAARLGHADLRPVMTVSAALVAVREAAPGDAVGYGATYRFDAPGRVGTVALGYADGVPVSLTNCGRVHLDGVPCAMIGRVSMDSFGIDLTGSEAEVGDRVIFFGDGLDYDARVEAQSSRAGTIPYELLVRVGARVPRRYLEAED
jgi:alanine racemase